MPHEPATPALDAWTSLRRADARLTRIEAQLETVEQAIAALRELIAEDAASRRELIEAHRDQLEADARAEYAALCTRLDEVRAEYDRLAAGLDEQLLHHVEKRLDTAGLTAAQRASSDGLRATAAELANLDRLRLQFEEAFGAPPAPAAAAPAPEVLLENLPTASVPVAAPAITATPEPTPEPTPVPTPPPLADVPFPPPLPTPIPLAETPADEEPTAVLVEAHAASSGAAHAVHDGLQIGRAIDNQLRVLDPSVSRQHATIVVRSGAFVLEDLESQNGTFVNGERIRQRVLCDGDRIGIGEAAFIFRTGGSDPASQAGRALPPQ